jgi:arylsulfatase A-like enzyme
VTILSASYWRVVLHAACCLALCAACSRTPPPNVVVIVLDTARPDFMSAYGHPRPTTPYLEAFAEQATRFDRAYSTSSWTLPAHASLFSGTLPEQHGATQKTPHVGDDLPLLAERLARAGYQTAGFSNNPWVSQRTGLARGFEHFQERWKLGTPRPANEDHPTVKAVAEWFASRKDPERPWFVFVNLIEPHMPYTPSWKLARDFFTGEAQWADALARMFPKGRPQAITHRHYAGKEPLTDAEWQELVALYEGDLLACDQITRAIMQHVERAGTLENTLVFLLSDHGENLGDHGHISHVFNVFDSNLKIALFARGKGFEPGRREDRLAQIQDVYPTVLRAAGLEVEPTCSGRDLRDGLSAQRALSASLDFPVLSLETFPAELRASGVLAPYERELEAAVGARYKLIRGSDGSEQLFDLVDDPGEKRPLEPGRVPLATVGELQGALEAARAAKSATPAARAKAPSDPESLEALRALGYTE